MEQERQFDYYYGKEAEQFTFFRIPKTLFTDPFFSDLSVEAKVLYGVLLDRMSLSIKNQWCDDKNRVYIIFTIEEIMEVFSWGRNKAVQMMKELEKKGLIEKKRLGLGRPNRIFVKNFIQEKTTIQEKEKEQPEREEKKTSIWKPNLQKFEKQTSRSGKNKLPEVPKQDPNNTDKNKTEDNHTEKNNTFLMSEKRSWEEDVEQTLKKNISYEKWKDRPEKEQVDILLEIMLRAITEKETRFTGGLKKIPQEQRKEHLLQLRQEHIHYVLEYLKEYAPNRISNPNAYLLTLLWNAKENVEKQKILQPKETSSAFFHYEEEQKKWEEFLEQI